METSQGDTQVVSVGDLEVIPGRHGYHFEPDFCGQMNVVLDKRSPDRVTFSCDTSLVVEGIYILSGSDNQMTRVRVTRSNGNRYTATVIDDSALPH